MSQFYHVLKLGVSNPIRNPTNPSNPPKPEPTTPTVGDGFLTPRPDIGGLSGGFSSPKPEPPDPTDVIYKSGNIRRHSREIWQYPATFKRDLVRSGDIRGDPSEISTIFGEIRRDSRRSKLISAIFGADLLGFCRFRRIF